MNKIKQLREKTGVGIIDCKKALEETNNDIDAAVEFLRKKGIAKATKRENRETNEGVILVESNDTHDVAYMLEINSETDFVAKNEKFQELAKDIFELLKTENPANLDELNNLSFRDSSVLEEVSSLSGIIGEKIKVSNLKILKGEMVGAYSHMGGKIGAIVSFDQKIDTELANSIAMHITATNPKYIVNNEVPQDMIDKEKEIYREELITSGKPENILDKIIEGKINKYMEEICLVKQEYIKEDKKKVEEVLGETNIVEFTRYSLN